jgi:alkylation response protein AidB-like acyl-CoA dehydrogenase
MPNPLLNDRDVEFVLYEILEAGRLCELPDFADHSRETFDLFLGSAKKFAREVLYPAYKPMDELPPKLEGENVKVHPLMKALYPRLVELGMMSATRPVDVGGQQLPFTIASAAGAYLAAANLSAAGYLMLTTGAARLIESFGNAWLKAHFMQPMYAGTWTGTMALTEPQAGSSLTDVKTKATPRADGRYSIRGSKVFISGGDQDITENIVHLTLARIEGAPAGIKGVSLFAIPKLRPEDGKLVPNDCTTAGVFHKIGYRGLPSIALNFGDKDDCLGWLVGEPNRGIRCMFQLMNEARVGVGMQGVATAGVAYQEALEYAKSRPQGRPLDQRDPTTPQIPIIEHNDVRRMLLRQKAIVEGGFSLLLATARYFDLSEHAASADERKRAAALLDLLTPVAKSFPAEKGFESNVLAVQVHGGYGYTSEYLPEAWMRDQKLNSIHEGTSGIQSMDLLGRKVVAEGGSYLRQFVEEVTATSARARSAGVDPAWCDAVDRASAEVAELTTTLAMRGLSGDITGMMLHSFDYLDLFGTYVIGWQWLVQATVAKIGLERGSAVDRAFYEGKLHAAQYWIKTELPRIAYLSTLAAEGEDSYAKIPAESF